ncbi:MULTISPECIES: hypothetical protein [Oceanobacillus]|uniref:hypothetical protein n=1 Tax=Oceanobacillus TaxID=182709 RepID=UPI001867435A|nr:hypothetical protein [Oceanobacillus oncorhynchi]
MKKHIKFSCYSLLLPLIFLLIACSDNTNNEDNSGSATDKTTEEPGTADDEDLPDGEESEDPSESDNSSEDSSENDSNDQSSDEAETDASEDSSVEEEESNDSSSEDEEAGNDQALSDYSSEEIEYARVWLQLGPNQDIDELYVEHIPAGTPLDPNDEENDISYPEDVIQVSGSRIADGMITYSGNGDGTINVYDIPYGNRWYGGMPRPDDVDLEEVKEDMREIIENTETVTIEPGEEEDVIAIIEKMYIID